MPATSDRAAAMRQILERHSLFGSLTPGELDQLLAHARVESFRARQEIFAFSQRELGSMIGLSRESINKQLSLWQQDGIIKLDHGIITILDQAALGEAAASS